MAAMAQVAPPFDLTYVAPVQDLPPWLSYTSSATATSIAYYTVATLDASGNPILLSGSVVLTQYETQIIQLPLTVDVPYKVDEPYTNAGGTGPTVAIILGVTGSAAEITLGATSTVSPAAAATTVQPATTLPPTTTSRPAATTGAPSSSATTRSASPTSAAGTSSDPVVVLSSGAFTTSHSSSSSASSIAPSLPNSSSSATTSTPTTMPAVAVLTWVTTNGVAMMTYVTAEGTSTPTGLLTSPGSSSTGSTSATGAASPANLNSSSNRLSGGAISGIVVGSIVGALLLLLLLLCCIRRRRSQRRSYSAAAHQWDFIAPRRIAARPSPSMSGGRGSEATTGGSGSRSDRLLGLIGIRRGSRDNVHGRGDGNESFGGGSHGSIASREEEGPMMRELTMAGPEPTTPHRAERGALLSAFHEHLDSSSNENHEEATDEAYGDGYYEQSQRGFDTPPRSIQNAVAATSLLKGIEDDWQPNSPMTPATPGKPRPNSMDGLIPAVQTLRNADSSAPASNLPKRRPISEMGWLSGRGSLDPSSASSRGSSNPTAGSRSSGGSSDRRSRRLGPAFLARPVSGGQDSGRSRGTSLDKSPNLNELFYTTPRWTGAPGESAGTPPRRYTDAETATKASPYRSPYRDVPYMRPAPTTRDRSSGSTSGTSSAIFGRLAAGFGSALSGLGLAPATARDRETSYESNVAGGSYNDPFASGGMMSPSASAPLIRDYPQSPSRSVRRGVRGPREPSTTSQLSSQRSMTFGALISAPPISMAGSIVDPGSTEEDHRPRSRMSARSGEGVFSDALTNEDEEDDNDLFSEPRGVSMIGSSVYDGLEQRIETPSDAEDDQDGDETFVGATRNRMPDIRDFRSVTVTSFGTLGQPLDHSPPGRDTGSIYSSHSSLQAPYQTYSNMASGAAPGRFISHQHHSSSSTTRTGSGAGGPTDPSEDSGIGRSPASEMAEVAPGLSKPMRRNTLGREEIEEVTKDLETGAA